jgi:hypothetical protein
MEGKSIGGADLEADNEKEEDHRDLLQKEESLKSQVCY